MKKLFAILSIVLLGFAASSCYDDSAIWESMDELNEKFKTLEETCNEMNENIESLNALVQAMTQGDYIVEVTPLLKNGVEIGYQIEFKESGTITIYHGEDGADSDTVPEFGVKKDTDGIYYWTVNGKWVLDDKGNKLPVSSPEGTSGVTPELKIENNKWYVSYDAGKTWTYMGDAAPAGSGNCLFKDVKLTDGYLVLTMSDGTVLEFPVGERFSIVFGDFDAESIHGGKNVVVPYTIVGTQGKPSVFALSSGSIFAAEIVEETSLSGSLIISQNYIDSVEHNGKVALFAVAEDGTTVSKVVELKSGVLYTASSMYGETFVIGAEGGQISFTICTNRDFEVSTNADWVSYVPTKAVEEKTLIFNVEQNDGSRRSAVVQIRSGYAFLHFIIEQAAVSVNLTNALSYTDGLQWGLNYVYLILATEGVYYNPDTGSYEGAGDYLSLEIYSEDGRLHPGTYYPSSPGEGTNPGEFSIGQDFDFSGLLLTFGTFLSHVDGGATTQEKVIDGIITVEENDGIYTISSQNSTTPFTFTGQLPVTNPSQPEVPVGEVEFTELLSCSTLAQSSQAVIQLVSGDVTATYDETTWQTTYTGTGKIWNLTIHAEGTDGDSPYIATGKYDADPESLNPFTWQVTGGMDLGEYGMGYMYWGTFIYDVIDGVSTVRELHEGTVKVTANGDIYTIVYENGTEKYTYTGQLPGLSAPPQQESGEESFDGTALTQFVSFTEYETQNGINLIGMELVSDGLTVTMEEMSWGDYTWMQAVIKGSGNHLKIEFYSEDGTLAPGTYTASADPSALKEGEFCTGYDLTSDWGTFSYGTIWSTYTDDQVTNQEKVTDGAVVVEENNGIYTITLNSSTVNARYVGPLQ